MHSLMIRLMDQLPHLKRVLESAFLSTRHPGSVDLPFRIVQASFRGLSLLLIDHGIGKYAVLPLGPPRGHSGKATRGLYLAVKRCGAYSDMVEHGPVDNRHC